MGIDAPPPDHSSIRWVSRTCERYVPFLSRAVTDWPAADHLKQTRSSDEKPTRDGEGWRSVSGSLMRKFDAFSGSMEQSVVVVGSASSGR